MKEKRVSIGKKILKIIGLLLLAVVLVVMASIVVCKFYIKTTYYTESISGISSSARIVFIADLHSEEYGSSNSRLIEKIAEQEPDVIFCVGDMIGPEASEEDVEAYYTLLQNLLEIAPVCVSNGNHEQEYIEATGIDIFSEIEDLGITVVDENYADIQIGDNTVRVGGTLNYLNGMYLSEEELQKQQVWMTAYCNTDLPKLFLAHMPWSVLLGNGYGDYDLDLVLSGHTHGGLIRIPGVGGLYAPPWEEWWPTFDEGYFRLYGTLSHPYSTDLIITSGLAGYEWIPRVFNLPEICVVDLEPGQ